jgi:ACS family glucarate transporter-like MFS transporter
MPEGTLLSTPRPSRIRWVLILWIFVVAAVAFLDRVNISIAGQSIAQEFHLSTVQLGWVFSAFVAGYALFQAPGGWIADRLGPRKTLAFGVLWWAAFTSLITFVSPGMAGVVGILIGLRLGLGMGEAVMFPASNCVVAAWIPSSERGLANGIIFAGVGVGSSVTPPLIVYFLFHYGWRASFWMSAGLGLIAGGIWYLIARDTPREHPWVSSEEAELIEAGLPKLKDHSAGARLSWKQIVSDRNVLAITVSYFCYGYAAYIFVSWFFIYLNAVRGLNLKQSSYYTMLPFAAMAAGSSVGGWVSDVLTRAYGKRAGRCFFAAAAIGLAAVLIALGAKAASAELASLVLAGGVGMLYLSQSSFWSVSADIGGRSAGAVSGTMNMGGQFGGVITASLTPAIANHFGWSASFMVAAAMCAAGALAWLPVHVAQGEDGFPASERV